MNVETLEGKLRALRAVCGDDEVYQDPARLIQDIAENSGHLSEAYDAWADAEYLLSVAQEEESKARARKYIEIVADKRYKTAKVDHLNSLVNLTPEVSFAVEQVRLAKRRSAQAKGLIEKFAKRSFGLTDITNIIRKTE